jgi:hypothetical protein
VYLADGHLAAFRILGAGPDLGDMMARYLEFHRGRGNDPSIGVRLARLLESAGLHVISFHGAYGIMTVPPGIRPPAWAARQRMLTDRIIDHGMLRRRETRPQPARHIPVRPTIFAPQFIAIGQRTTGTKQPGGCNITKRYPERGYLRAANRVGMSGASHSKSAIRSIFQRSA